MKKFAIFAIATAALFSGVVAVAQDTKSVTPVGNPGKAQMDEHMKKLQTLHDRLMSATTPEKRQKAMDEARKEMQDGMLEMLSNTTTIYIINILLIL